MKRDNSRATHTRLGQNLRATRTRLDQNSTRVSSTRNVNDSTQAQLNSTRIISTLSMTIKRKQKVVQLAHGQRLPSASDKENRSIRPAGAYPATQLVLASHPWNPHFKSLDHHLQNQSAFCSPAGRKLKCQVPGGNESSYSISTRRILTYELIESSSSSSSLSSPAS